MRSSYPTDDELRSALERFLGDVAAGRPPRLLSCTGLDMQVEAAMMRIAKAMPKPPNELIQAARDELERQIDGTHAKNAEAQLLSDLKNANRH